MSSVDAVIEPYQSVLDLFATEAWQVERGLAAFESAVRVGVEQAPLAAEFMQAGTRVGEENGGEVMVRLAAAIDHNCLVVVGSGFGGYANEIVESHTESVTAGGLDGVRHVVVAIVTIEYLATDSFTSGFEADIDEAEIGLGTGSKKLIKVGVRGYTKVDAKLQRFGAAGIKASQLGT